MVGLRACRCKGLPGSAALSLLSRGLRAASGGLVVEPRAHNADWPDQSLRPLCGGRRALTAEWVDGAGSRFEGTAANRRRVDRALLCAAEEFIREALPMV